MAAVAPEEAIKAKGAANCKEAMVAVVEAMVVGEEAMVAVVEAMVVGEVAMGAVEAMVVGATSDRVATKTSNTAMAAATKLAVTE